MFKKLSLSIALYGLLLTPLSPLGVYESYNIVDFVNRNYQTGDQSKPNRVKTHNPLSYQSPNILTNIEGVPNLDTQQFVKVERVERLPRYVIRVSQINHEGYPIYIVKQVREMRQIADDSEIDERLRRY